MAPWSKGFSSMRTKTSLWDQVFVSGSYKCRTAVSTGNSLRLNFSQGSTLPRAVTSRMARNQFRLARAFLSVLTFPEPPTVTWKIFQGSWNPQNRSLLPYFRCNWWRQIKQNSYSITLAIQIQFNNSYWGKISIWLKGNIIQFNLQKSMLYLQ